MPGKIQTTGVVQRNLHERLESLFPQQTVLNVFSNIPPQESLCQLFNPCLSDILSCYLAALTQLDTDRRAYPFHPAYAGLRHLDPNMYACKSILADTGFGWNFSNNRSFICSL